MTIIGDIGGVSGLMQLPFDGSNGHVQCGGTVRATGLDAEGCIALRLGSSGRMEM